MNKDLNRIAQQLEQASTPEAVFGAVGGTGAEQAAELKQVYHRLAKLTHPDRYTSPEDQAAAQVAFSRLSAWYALAEEKCRAGVYGQSGSVLELRTKRHIYRLDGSYSETPLYHCYPAAYTENGLTYPVTIKLVRDPDDNTAASNETSALQILAHSSAAKKYWPYIPRLLDWFVYEEDGLDYWATVLERLEGWYTLDAVQKAYPQGLDPRDMAWMWRRLLVALGYAHTCGLVHGAVLPCHVLIQPEQHGLMLVEWSCSVIEPASGRGRIRIIDPEYAEWYPLEVHAQEPPVPGTDIAMAARCMIYLLGGDPAAATCPASTPDFLRLFFKGCTLPWKRSRPQDAWALLEEFDDVIQLYWGERTFRPFVMTPTNA